MREKKKKERKKKERKKRKPKKGIKGKQRMEGNNPLFF